MHISVSQAEGWSVFLRLDMVTLASVVLDLSGDVVEQNQSTAKQCSCAVEWLFLSDLLSTICYSHIQQSITVCPSIPSPRKALICLPTSPAAVNIRTLVRPGPDSGSSSGSRPNHGSIGRVTIHRPITRQIMIKPVIQRAASRINLHSFVFSWLASPVFKAPPRNFCRKRAARPVQ